MAQRIDTSINRLDDAARAGWLYYVAGNTQEEIASKLGISRQSAQRLVSLSVSEGLIKVRLDHPIGRCMDLAARLRSRFGLIPSRAEQSLAAASADVHAAHTLHVEPGAAVLLHNDCTAGDTGSARLPA